MTIGEPESAARDVRNGRPRLQRRQSTLLYRAMYLAFLFPFRPGAVLTASGRRFLDATTRFDDSCVGSLRARRPLGLETTL